MEGHKKGYVDGGYRFFYLEDENGINVDYHYHAFHKCILVMDGEVDYTVEGRCYSLKEGDILWVPSHDAHKVEVADDSLYRRIVVYLKEEFIGLLSRELSDSIGRFTKELPNHVPMPQYVVERFSELIPVHALQDQDNHLGLVAGFIEWMQFYFYEMERHADKPGVQHHSKDVERVVNHIKANYSEPLTVEELSEMAYLSKYHFMRKFKEVMGVSVHQYILNQRLRRARELMKQGVSLTGICYQVGFKDYSTFARAFKKTYMKSPRQFMKLKPDVFA